MRLSRRAVLEGLAGTLAAPLLLTRAEAEVTPELVRFRPEMEPLVALLERTPREKCAEMAVEQLRRGVSYRQLLGALFLAGVRNVNPQPPGFALHCVFVIHSAHLLGLEAPADSRLLPLFYALDDFKASQERDARAAGGDYTMRALGGALPAPERAAAELAAGLDAWDGERAERAAASLARHRSAGEIFELLWRYGARDYRNIGHKAIFAANAYRTLQTIGWQHAEPVLRSLALAMVAYGKEQKVNGYGVEDQCYAGNLKRLRETFPRLHPEWAAGPAGAAGARALLEAIRTAALEAACAEASARLVKGSVTAAAVWDAVHLAAAELRMRARGGAALASVHAVTSANALHYAYLASTDPQTRYLLLLQGVGWMTQFRTFADGNPANLRAFAITDLAPAEPEPLEKALPGTLAAVPSNPESAAARVFRMAEDPAARSAYLAAAVRSTASKVSEVHYYKYLAALIEDIPLASPEWQPHLLATTVYYLKGAADPEPASMKRAREALRALPA